MKLYFFSYLIFFTLINNISYAQSYECDNNYNDCGTPEQSGGGGGGKGSIRIANTDLGDSYQHADDYDDDGIEDSSDNCMRYPNPYQLDYDADGIGNMCDNCLYTFNPDQKDYDGDQIGNDCDNDIDGDNIDNIYDKCIFHWGEQCFELADQHNNKIEQGSNINNSKENTYTNDINNIDIENSNFKKDFKSCDQKRTNNLVWVLLILLISIFFSNQNHM